MDMFNKKKIADLTMERDTAEDVCEDLRGKIRILDERNENLKESLDIQIEENKRLQDWIEKILMEFGTRDVYNNSVVKIPVWRRHSSHCNLERLEQEIREEIIVPQIIITKSRIEPYEKN